MTEHSANSQDSARQGWHLPSQHANALSIGTSTGTVEIRTTRKNLCPACGERLQGRTESCPACGENLVQPPKQIRCMHCHTTASSELVVCPGCGRELREAPPKLITLGAPIVLALLLVTVIVSQWERISPIAWARANLVRGVVLVEDLGASIEPEMVIVMTPIVEESAANPVAAEGVPGGEAQSAAMADSLITPLPDPNASQSEEQTVQTSIMAAAATQAPIGGVGGPQPTETASALNAAPESLPTEAPTATNTPLPTPTALPPTATSEPTAAKAEGIAGALAANETGSAVEDTATETDAATNAEASAAPGGMAAALAASETTLPTATSTPTIATTPLPTPTATPVVYQVQSGDTLVTIAAEYDVDVEELMAANDMSEDDVYVIQPGQMLFIPMPAPELVSAASSDLSAVRVEAPLLMVPPAGAIVGCATGGTLIWQRVQFVKDSDKYVLHLGFVNGRSNNGQESVAWVLAQSAPVTATEWNLDTSLCDLAPEEYDRQWRWWVEVVEEADGETISVSPPSEVRGFIWE